MNRADDLKTAMTIIRNLRSVIASGGRGFADGTHIQMADTFLKNRTKMKEAVEAESTETKILLWGNPIEGYKAFGPFENQATAWKFAEDMGEGGEWTMDVHPPTDEAFFREMKGIAT